MKTKSNMTLVKLQSEAVKEFEELRTTSYENPIVISDEEAEDIKQFLSDQIQKAVEETRKEDIEVIKKHRPVFFKKDIKSLMTMDESMRVREVLRIEILEELGVDCSEMRNSLKEGE